MAHADIPVTEQEFNIVKTVFENSQRNIQQTLEHHYNTTSLVSPSGLKKKEVYILEMYQDDLLII